MCIFFCKKALVGTIGAVIASFAFVLRQAAQKQSGYARTPIN